MEAHYSEIKEILDFDYEGTSVYIIQEDSVHGRYWHSEIINPETGARLRICNNFPKDRLQEMFTHTFNYIEKIPLIAARNAALLSRS